MKSFKSLSTSERTAFNSFHAIHFDLNILDVACKQLMSNPDPDFICCLSSKLSTFIQDEVLPLVRRHDDTMSPYYSSSESKIYNPDNHEKENNETDVSTH